MSLHTKLGELFLGKKKLYPWNFDDKYTKEQPIERVEFFAFLQTYFGCDEQQFFQDLDLRLVDDLSFTSLDETVVLTYQELYAMIYESINFSEDNPITRDAFFSFVAMLPFPRSETDFNKEHDIRLVDDLTFECPDPENGGRMTMRYQDIYDSMIKQIEKS